MMDHSGEVLSYDMGPIKKVTPHLYNFFPDVPVCNLQKSWS